MRSLRFLTAAASFAVPPGVPGAQTPVPVVSLDAPSAHSAERLTRVVDVKGLPGGSVLVNVPDQRRLLLLDATLGRVTVIADTLGTTNLKYPVEVYVSLIAYAGDSTLFADYASRTFTVLDEAGTPGRVIAPPKAQDYLNLVIRRTGAQAATDPRGRIIYRGTTAMAPVGATAGAGGRGSQVVGGGTPRTPPDSQPIVRGDFATRTVDTLAYYKVQVSGFPVFGPMRAGEPRTALYTVNPVLPAVDDWAVLTDGTVAIVRGADYHIDWIAPDGTKTSTAKLPFDWRRLSETDKLARLDSAKAVIDSLIAIGEHPYRMIMSSSARTDTVLPRIEYAIPDSMPDYFPPIRAGAVMADADNNVWILPTTSSSARGGLLYDVVNRRGELFQRVQLPAERIIAGFGRGGVVYLLAREPDNSWYLERTRVTAARSAR